MFQSGRASAGRRPALEGRCSILSTLAAGLVLSTGASAVFAHGRTVGEAPSATYWQAASRGHPVELDGTLQVLHEDFADGTGRYHYFLERDAERIELHFKGEPTREETGARIRVKGKRADQNVAVESGSRDVASLSSGSGTVLKALAVSGSFGAQRTAVMLVNFSDNPAQPYSVASARSVVFTTTSNFDFENSYGQTSLTGDVFGWYTIALSSSACDYSTLATQAQAAARAAGVNLSNYNRYVYAFPSNACGWWGLGTVGGNPSSAWVNGSFQLAVVGHEMGHNFGLYHSHALECGNVPIGAGCTSVEYGDQLDVMGNSNQNHFNAFQKERLGWLNYGSSPPITTVASGGTYSIDAYETIGTGPKALKIPIGTTGGYYYVEWRRAVGFDAGLSSNANVMNGVVLHQASPSNADSSELLDMTATTSWNDPALLVGQSFTDTGAQITITPISVTSTNALVSVTMGAAGCTRANPSLALSPSSGTGVAAGTAVTFTATLTNNDAGNCGASTFDLTYTVPSGWGATLASASLVLSPGASSSTTLQVTSAASAANGSYPVNATAKNHGATAYQASAAATYVVSTTGGGPTGSFADDFNRADSATTIGAAWSVAAGKLVISGNALKNAPQAGSAIAVVPGLSGATQTAGADFTSVDNNLGPRFGIVLRYQDPKNYYLIYRQTGGSSRLLISKFVNGVETILGAASIANPAKNVPFHMTARIAGSTISLDFDSTVNKVKATDSAATFSTGTPGIMIGAGSSSTTQQVADNFTATAQ